MRFKLLRRRLTISAPQMAVRSTMPWPLKWAGIAIMLGFWAAISMGAFELGKSIAGIETGAKEELLRVRADADRLRAERDTAQSQMNGSYSLITAERATQAKLAAQIKALEMENRALRDDLGFFEKLMPASGSQAVAIRALQAEVVGGVQLRWQILLIHPVKNAAEFRGKLQMSIAGSLDGKPWEMELPGGPQPLAFRQYRRVEGLVDLPPQAVVKNVSAKVVEGAATRAVQTIQL
jgi:hypothetical protein